MKNKILLFLALSLTALAPIAHADFLDLAGSIIWHSSDNGVGFIDMFSEAVAQQMYDCDTQYDVDLRLTQNNGSFNEYQGWTLLMMAAHIGCYSAVDVLLQAGANVLLKNNNDQTAIHLAIAAKHEDIVNLIAIYSRPKTLVDRALEVVISMLAGKENKEESLKYIKSVIPSDLVRALTPLLRRHEDAELQRLGLCLAVLFEPEENQTA